MSFVTVAEPTQAEILRAKQITDGAEQNAKADDSVVNAFMGELNRAGMYNGRAVVLDKVAQVYGDDMTNKAIVASAHGANDDPDPIVRVLTVLRQWIAVQHKRK